MFFTGQQDDNDSTSQRSPTFRSQQHPEERVQPISRILFREDESKNAKERAIKYTRQQQQQQKGTLFEGTPESKNATLLLEDAELAQHDIVRSQSEKRILELLSISEEDFLASKCALHIDEDLLFVCFDCARKCVCVECVSSGLHQGHDVRNVRRAKNEVRAEVQEGLARFRSQIETLAAQNERVGTRKSDTVELRDRLKGTILQGFAELRELLNNKEQELLTSTEDFVVKRISTLEELGVRVRRRLNVLINAHRVLEGYFQDLSDIKLCQYYYEKQRVIARLLEGVSDEGINQLKDACDGENMRLQHSVDDLREQVSAFDAQTLKNLVNDLQIVKGEIGSLRSLAPAPANLPSKGVNRAQTLKKQQTRTGTLESVAVSDKDTQQRGLTASFTNLLNNNNNNNNKKFFQRRTSKQEEQEEEEVGAQRETFSKRGSSEQEIQLNSSNNSMQKMKRSIAEKCNSAFRNTKTYSAHSPGKAMAEQLWNEADEQHSLRRRTPSGSGDSVRQWLFATPKQKTMADDGTKATKNSADSHLRSIFESTALVRQHRKFSQPQYHHQQLQQQAQQQQQGVGVVTDLAAFLSLRTNASARVLDRQVANQSSETATKNQDNSSRQNAQSRNDFQAQQQELLAQIPPHTGTAIAHGLLRDFRFHLAQKLTLNSTQKKAQKNLSMFATPQTHK